MAVTQSNTYVAFVLSSMNHDISAVLETLHVREARADEAPLPQGVSEVSIANSVHVENPTPGYPMANEPVLLSDSESDTENSPGR